MSKEEYIAAVGGYNFLEERARLLAKDYLKEYGTGTLDNVDIEADGIAEGEIYIESSYWCGEACSEWYTIPATYLYLDNWRELEDAKLAEQKRIAKEHEATRKAEAEIQQEKARYELYLELKKKYEG